MTTAEQRWSEQLAAWAIPDEILAQAPQSPWIHPVRMFTVTDDEPVDSVSRSRALEALPSAGSVLDVGSGGGRASLALVPPAAHLVAVDRSEEMLGAYAEAAAARGVSHEEHLGPWPDIADEVPVADVVVCHHVVYDVAGLTAFALALDSHAVRRVVLELPARHPLAGLAPLWRRFWGLERPEGPTSDDCVDVLREAGLPARVDLWDDAWSARRALTPEEHARFTRIRLCLPEDREAEVAAALAEMPEPGPRRTATVWWDR